MLCVAKPLPSAVWPTCAHVCWAKVVTSWRHLGVLRQLGESELGARWLSAGLYSGGGQRFEGNNYTLDDTNTNGEARKGVTNIVPNSEAAEEDRITANNFSAVVGRSSDELRGATGDGAEQDSFGSAAVSFAAQKEHRCCRSTVYPRNAVPAGFRMCGSDSRTVCSLVSSQQAPNMPPMLRRDSRTRQALSEAGHRWSAMDHHTGDYRSEE